MGGTHLFCTFCAMLSAGLPQPRKGALPLMHIKVLEGSEGLAEAWTGCGGMQDDSSPEKPSMASKSSQASPVHPTPASPAAGTVPQLWLRQELPLLWAKDKKECRLVSRIIKLHAAYSCRARPVLVGLRAVLRPAGLRLPLMRIMIRRLNDNSALILCARRPRVGQLGRREHQHRPPPPDTARSPGPARGRGHPPVLLQSGQRLLGWD